MPWFISVWALMNEMKEMDPESAWAALPCFHACVCTQLNQSFVPFDYPVQHFCWDLPPFQVCASCNLPWGDLKGNGLYGTETWSGVSALLGWGRKGKFIKISVSCCHLKGRSCWGKAVVPGDFRMRLTSEHKSPRCPISQVCLWGI